MNSDLLASVETRMREAISASDAEESPVIRAALDHLSAGGSRIRARLSLHASGQLGISDPDSITLAAVCELLHNASLIQDDLLDRAPLRRAVPSVWAIYGDATAVCAGDLLLASAFALIADLHLTQLMRPVLLLVHRCTREVILGQGIEQSCAPDTLKAYEKVAIAKSGSLLSLPLELSLLVSGQEQFIPVAQQAADAFATAYQMMDDLQDYDEDVLSGALNVISVALQIGESTYEAAHGRVSQRIEELLQILAAEALALPMDCGTAFIKHAEEMSLKLSLHPESSVQGTGFTHHAR